jgi:tetratricopeptide (TPR) repeat protein
MTRQRSFHSSRLFVLALMLACPGVEAGAQEWHENYRDGLTALRQEKFTEAVAHLSQAIAQRPESKANARAHGVRFIDYYPYVYRGIAYARLGQTSLALKDFEKEHAAGEVYNGIHDTKAGTLLRERLAEYRTRVTSQPPPQQPLQAGKPDSLFNAAVHDLEQGNIVKAKALFQEVRKIRPAYPGMDGYNSKIRGFEQDVRKGIGAFLDGKYVQAVNGLTPAAELGRDHANVQAFLGCSYAALYLLSGGENKDAREKAFAAFRRTKRIDPTFDLKRAYVSPAIQELFASAKTD